MRHPNRGIPFPRDLCDDAQAGNDRAQRVQMYPESEPRRGSLGGTVFAVVVIALTCYLTFAALQGEHGLFQLFRVDAQETRLRAELTALLAERARIANKTERLSLGSLDLELLDEQARKVLGLGRPDEILIR
jgi:cell division protein FtsB